MRVEEGVPEALPILCHRRPLDSFRRSPFPTPSSLGVGPRLVSTGKDLTLFPLMSLDVCFFSSRTLEGGEVIIRSSHKDSRRLSSSKVSSEWNFQNRYLHLSSYTENLS